MRRISLLAGVLASLALTACGINPVTGERELQLISESQELQLGEQNYVPMQQAEGGPVKVVPELTQYVNEVGQKLAAVADRKLPYEFIVLNNSVPNAWALPGGKIAVNRGLLTQLQNEAQLAAVLGHEIVHAAARHGAKAQERSTLLQAGIAVAQIGAVAGGVDPNLTGALVQGAGIGAQLIQQRYSREQELQADHYGMKYMKLAGYDPTGAVTLQEAFVRLAEQKGGNQQGWLEGLFASHPPSQERVDENKRTAAELGRGGTIGAESYAMRLKPLRAIEPAYEKYDQAVAAAHDKDYARATRLAEEASRLVPRESSFHDLLGQIKLAQEQPQAAIGHFRQAMELNPDYFASYLGGGVAEYKTGDKNRAEQWLLKSMQLLPTAPAAYYLGNIARDRGDQAKAMEYYRAAAGSDSGLGKQAAAELIRIDLSQNPQNYLATAGQLDARGQLLVVVQNRAPVALTNLQITPVLIDNAGRIIQQGRAVVFSSILQPGEQASAPAGIGGLTQQQLATLRFRVDSARVAQ